MSDVIYDDEMAERDPSDGLDADDFAMRVRVFEHEAHQVLARPSGSFRDLMALHWQAWSLANEARGARAPEVDRWVLVTRRAVAARLNR